MVWSQRRAWFVGLLVVASTLVRAADDRRRQGCSATDDGAALTSGRDDGDDEEDRSDPAAAGRGPIARAEDGDGGEPDHDDEPTDIAIERCGSKLTSGRCRGTCFAATATTATATVQREHHGRPLRWSAASPDRAGHGFRVPAERGRRHHAVPVRGHRRLRGVRHQSSHDPECGCRRERVGIPRRQRPHPVRKRGARRVHRAGRLRRRSRPVQRLLEDRDGGGRLRPEHPTPAAPDRHRYPALRPRPRSAGTGHRFGIPAQRLHPGRRVRGRCRRPVHLRVPGRPARLRRRRQHRSELHGEAGDRLPRSELRLPREAWLRGASLVGLRLARDRRGRPRVRSERAPPATTGVADHPELEPRP